MPVRAMKVTSKTAHEKTDTLFIYTFESPEVGERTIVANLENTYEVGDIAGVALEGTFLPGLEIKPRKVFGIHSEGMALGVVDAAIDADLTEKFEADAPVRTFKVTLEVEVEARYAEDAKNGVKKAVKQDKGTVVGIS
ncbi:MAG: hypothetical protein GY913_33340 [Proteobacteria bacterium]|nr:hypothetical protein [Pseudomonadota bacterium]MCP4921811.1 hypothetical protein [Pseudomonadota bacterium]